MVGASCKPASEEMMLTEMDIVWSCRLIPGFFFSRKLREHPAAASIDAWSLFIALLNSTCYKNIIIMGQIKLRLVSAT
jgi:hypothetical protein